MTSLGLLLDSIFLAIFKLAKSRAVRLWKQALRSMPGSRGINLGRLS
jgi:hypothetical protein